MTVFPARRTMPPGRALPPGSTAAEAPGSRGALEPVRPNPLEWARRRRAEREARRLEAAGARALSRLDHLGPAWHVAELPSPDTPAALLDSDGVAERHRFLAIGPSGLFAVTVADHGRARVMVAGDVVQINGKRPTYVSDARREARRASRALSEAVGLNIPVAPVLTFVGSGVISVYGLPKECLVATHRELDRLLVAGGERISPATADKLYQVANAPATWGLGPQSAAADYRWYAEGRTAADKQATRR
ncbi:hypothetical protein [Plantactinospora sp. KBS50]|uniref:hypothetical protein n=1 Tax=Plantactinospora sp. KBS50 TaxID=2024580 RepID=UPI000BAB006D|nr:hypothetical protein [Plantactinospora sp. KBS50]ASW57249.1 hypothetical protein CIK06_28565 [Plantactinospora sp. KBS50]